MREISGNLNKEHVDSYAENNTLCEIEEREVINYYHYYAYCVQFI